MCHSLILQFQEANNPDSRFKPEHREHTLKFTCGSSSLSTLPYVISEHYVISSEEKKIIYILKTVTSYTLLPPSWRCDLHTLRLMKEVCQTLGSIQKKKISLLRLVPMIWKITHSCTTHRCVCYQDVAKKTAGWKRGSDEKQTMPIILSLSKGQENCLWLLQHLCIWAFLTFLLMKDYTKVTKNLHSKMPDYSTKCLPLINLLKCICKWKFFM